MEETRSFAPLLIVVVLAFIVPLLLSRLSRFSLPIVVGEILAGILVGQSGMRWVTSNDPVLAMLSQFGFVFLMFLSGMEIDFRSLRGLQSSVPLNQRPRFGAVSLAAFTFGLTLLLAMGASWGLVYLGLARNPWIVALIFSTTSLGVVVPVLKEREIITRPLGQSILIAAVVADFATMLLITVAVALMSRGLTADILLISVLFVAFFFTHRFGTLLNKISALRRTLEELSHATAQIKVRAAFTVMLIFVALSEALGTEVILGAFLAGAIISLLRTPDDTELVHQLEAIGFGFFIPIFFIMVGVDLNLPLLFRSETAVWLVPLFLVLAIIVKLLPALAFTLTFSFKEAVAAGILLSARLSLIIAAAAIGARIGVIGESTRAAIILVAIVTVTLAPWIFTRLMPGRGTGRIRPIVIVGAEELGLQVAEQLKAHHEQVVLLDFDAKRLSRATQRGFEVVTGAVDRRDDNASSLLESARALVCTYDDTELAYRACRFVKDAYKMEHVVAQVADPKELPRFESLGVTTTNATRDRARFMALLTRNPAMYALLSRTDDDKEVCEVTVLNDEHVGKKLRQIEFPGDILALALRRDGELLVPHGDTRLNREDRLTLVGSINDVEVAQRMFGRGKTR
jgi:CPA2 family monovalent cation:H+ antiporter-2